MIFQTINEPVQTIYFDNRYLQKIITSTFSTSRWAGRKFREVRAGNGEGALNFLDFFASFCVKTKMKRKLTLE